MASFFIRWGDNGTIVQWIQKTYRVAILHDGFMDNLFSSVESKLGFPIGHIAYEAQRNSSKAVFEGFTKFIPGSKMLLKIKPLRRIAVELFNLVGIITGQCLSETLEYKPGEYGVARISNPFNMRLMAANVVGAFETLEGIPYDSSYEQESEDKYIIKVSAAREKSEIAERMKLEFKPTLPGTIKFRRCPWCRIPIPIADSLKWVLSEGIILDRRTGARLVFVDGYMVTTVFRELANELGEEIYDLVVEAQRDWTINNVGALGLSGGEEPLTRTALEAAYRNYLEHLPLFGYGNPVSFKMSENKIEVVVENPYEASILAGTLQGLYEALEKSKSTVTWETPREGVASFTVSPA